MWDPVFALPAHVLFCVEEAQEVDCLLLVSSAEGFREQMGLAG